MGYRVTDPRHIDTFETVFDAAYQGAPGAFSEEAARALLGPTARLLPRTTLEDVFHAVAARGSRYGVVPVEDSVAGSVAATYELLLASEIKVLGETRANIDYVLAAAPDTTEAQVRRVLSHPIALAQCEEFFRRHRGIQAVPVFDTAGAVEIVMRDPDPQTAALAGRRAADMYGAVVLAEHLQDHPENWTRFLLLGRDEPPTLEGGEYRKALIACGLRNEPGALWHSLQPLAERGVNITKIEGRPIWDQPFEYRFIVEVTVPSGEARRLDEAIEQMRGVTAWLKVLGIYSWSQP